jgi:hypothetical protein
MPLDELFYALMSCEHWSSASIQPTTCMRCWLQSTYRCTVVQHRSLFTNDNCTVHVSALSWYCMSWWIVNAGLIQLWFVNFTVLYDVCHTHNHHCCYRLIEVSVFNSLWPGLSVPLSCLATWQIVLVDVTINDEFCTSWSMHIRRCVRVCHISIVC